MATEVGKAVVPVTFDKNQIGRDLSSSIESGAKSSEGHISSTFKRLAGLAAGAFAGVQVFGFVKDSIDAARESNKVAAQTEAVIKSTGGAAKLTAGDFSKLAESISAKTGIDDEAIQSAENLLATFTNIRNEVGANNDIFSQATKTAVDMGAALGGDAASNSILLGKALNDPIKGITALTRVGVTFTDDQRAQIKTMQEHGDILGAQKIILGELNKEFGGSAEATATAGAKWGVFWGNLQEKLGNLLIPMLDTIAEWAMTTLPNAFGFLQDALEPVVGGFERFWTVLTTGFTEDEGGTWFEEFAFILRDDVWPIIKQVSDFIANNWQPILIGLVVAFGLLAAPITTIVVGLTALYLKSKTFRDIVESTRVVLMDVFHVLQDTLGPAFLAIGAALADLARFFADRWDKIRGSVVTVLTILKIAIAVWIAPIVLAWRYFHDQILAVVQVVWDQISLYISTALRVIGDVFDVIISLLSGDWAGAWDAAKDIPAAFVDFVKGTLGNLLTFAVDFFSSLPANILTALGDLLTTLVPKGIELITGLLSGLWEKYLEVVTWFLGLPGALIASLPGWGASLLQLGINLMNGLWDGIKAVFFNIIDWFAGLPGRIVTAIGNLASTLLGAGADLVAGFLEGIKNAFQSFPGAKRGGSKAWGDFEIGPPEFGLPNLPFAKGGIFDRPTVGMFGEAGREVILPLTDFRRTWDLATRSGLLDVLAQGSRLAGTVKRVEMPNVGAALNRMGSGADRGGNTFQLTSGDVYVREPEDVVTGLRRAELMAGVR